MTHLEPQVDEALLAAAALVAERLDASAGTAARLVGPEVWPALTGAAATAATVDVEGAWDGLAALVLPAAVPGMEPSALGAVLTDAVHAMALQLGPLVPRTATPVEVGTVAAADGAPQRIAAVYDGDTLVAALVLTDARASGAPAAAAFRPFTEAGSLSEVDPRRLHLLRDVEMGISVELGRTRMTVQDVLSLAPGVVIELDRAAGGPVDVLVNGTLMARGEVVVVDEEFAVRVTEVISSDTDSRQRA